MKIFNNTLKAGLVAALMLSAGTVAIAQNGEKPEARAHKGQHQRGEHKMDRFKNMTIAERVEKRLEQMDKQLDLTDAQIAQLRPILTEDMQRLQNAREAMKAARTADKVQDKAAREAARAEMKAQAQVSKDRIASVLTPEQRAKAKDKIQQHRAKIRENVKERKQKRNGDEKLRHEKHEKREKREKKNAK